MTKPKASRRGFTLIELLMVIAIISLLISILLPALSRARESGRTVVCLSNHRQISHAQATYLEMFDEWLPRETGQMRNPQAFAPWPIAYRPLLDPAVHWIRDEAATNMRDHYEDAPYFKCPAYPTPEWHQIHYANNGISFREQDDRSIRYAGYKPIMKFTVIPNPSEVISLTAFADFENRWWEQLYRPGRSNYSIAILYDVREPSNFAADHAQRRLDTNRHPDGSNTMYMDGHATTNRWNEILDFRNWYDNDQRYNQGSAYWRARDPT